MPWRRPWLGWCVPRAFQPPRASFRQRCPSLSKGSFFSYLCSYVLHKVVTYFDTLATSIPCKCFPRPLIPKKVQS